jgi:probable DNA metabolism protein
MTRVYIYDDSFDGLLTALFTAYCDAIKIDSIAAESEFEENLFIEKITLITEPDKAAKAINIIANFISFEAMHNIFYAFLAESNNHGGIIYDYFKFGLEKGRMTDNFLHDPRVIEVHKLRDRLHIEKHRLFGLIRFKKVILENSTPLYYAECEPDNNVVGLLAPHFAHRLPGERWMIHDVKRGIAALNEPADGPKEALAAAEGMTAGHNNSHNKGINKKNAAKWSIVNINLNGEPELAPGEKLYQDLWRAFIKSVAIETKINPKLQRRCMPARYWKYLTEMQK